ncbi:MAG TPA: hypothetical protein VGL82_22960 [Bryobacteraceae bacterium]
MRTLFHRALFSTIAILAAANITPSVAQSQRPAPATTAYRAPRAPDGHADISGIWEALNTANSDLEDHPTYGGPYSQMGSLGAVPSGRGVVEGGAIPYKPEALAKKKENFANRWKLDPEVKCYMPGIPRATYMPFPFQIVQSAKVILMAYQYASTNRAINMEKPIEPSTDTWMGTQNGHWEGDTLVVNNTGFNDLSWFDRAGDFHSDQLHVVERFTPLDATHLTYEATIEDPQVFTRPWKIGMPLYRRIEKDAQLSEFKCVEYAEELLYGDLRKKK